MSAMYNYNPTNSDQHSDQNDPNDPNKNNHQTNDHSPIAVIMIVIWIVLGVMAYVSAFQCTHEKYTGSDARKIGMLILAGVLGPFYWLIQPSVRAGGYCNLK